MGYTYAASFRDQPFTDDHVDGFAGGGGASEGYELGTGRPVTAALNHNLAALKMHRANHRRTRHYCEDIRIVRPRVVCRGRRPRSAHFSPDCRDFSKAKGGKPKSKRVRGLAWVIIDWINDVCPGLITWENVEEFEGWCNLLPGGSRSPWRPGWFFRCLTGAMLRRGYHVQWRGADGIVYRRVWSGPEPVFVGGQILRWSGRASDFGVATIRQRHFGMARCDGLPIVWPQAGDAATRFARGLQPRREAADCLDFSLPCPSIFLTKIQARALGLNIKRPIALASRKRIARGVKRFVIDAAEPYLVNLTHQGNDGVESVRAPMKTITGAKRGEKALVKVKLAPFMTEHANASTQRNFSVREPLRTQAAQVKGGHFALISPVLFPRYGERKGQAPRCRSVRDKMPTVVGTGNGANLAAVHLAKVSTGSTGSAANAPFPTIPACSYHKRPGGNPPLAVIATHLAKLRGSPKTHPAGISPREPLHTVSSGGQNFGQVACFLAQNNGGMVGHDVRKPVSTVAGKGANQSFVAVHIHEYYGTDQNPHPRRPLPTVPTKDRFACISAELAAPPFTPELEARARQVANFLRRHGVKVDDEFATVTVRGVVYVIVDIGMRMLTARELFRAQGFRDSYIIGDDARQGLKLTKTQQVHMCGNSVCPPIMAAIYRANLPDLALKEAA